MLTTGIVPQSVRQLAREAIMSNILSGEFRPGSHLGISQLAASLGVSLTPVREALMQLEREGLVEVHPNRGFFVADFSVTEVQELFPIYWTLEVFALELQGLPSPVQLQELRRQNELLQVAESEPWRAGSIDETWHARLIRRCENEALRQQLAQLRRRIDRYEHAFMRVSGLIGKSVHQHNGILDLLTAGDLDAGKSALKAHWESGMRFLVDWLEATF